MKQIRSLARGLLLVACVSSCAVAHGPVAQVPAAKEEAPPQTLFTNVRVFDGKSDRLSASTSVLVVGNKIARIGKALRADARATVINGGGRTLLPGLIDSHTHLALVAPFAELEKMPWGEIGARMTAIAEDQLMRGFTTVRDFGGNTHGLRRAINAGAVPGPRIVSAGAFISSTSGHGDFGNYTQRKGETNMERIGMTRIADGPDEIRQAIRAEFRAGASFIKLMIGGGLSSAYDPLEATTYSQEEISAAVDEAKRWGTYASAHVYHDESIELCLKAGMKTLDHTNLASEEMYKRFAKEGIRIGAQVHALSLLKEYPMFTTPDLKRKAAWMADNGIATFGYAKKYGIPLGFGADFWGPIEQQRTNSAAIGGRKKYFTDAEILGQIYVNNVRLIEMTGERLPYKDGPLGEISKGAYADIIIVEGNPFEDVSILSDWQNKLKLVMKDGQIYRNEFRS